MSTLLSRTLAEAMDADERIIVLGEDVGRMGGVFGATRDLQRRFGPDRVLDTPISEQSFVGLAVGAAQAGLRPVVEVMFADFIGVCLDQVYNQMAKNHYMSGGHVRVPVVLRTAAGSIGDGAQHSQLLTGTFAHFPGLKVVLPANPGEARGLLLTALAGDDPVVFLEHKQMLVRRLADLHEPGALDSGPIPFGQARVAREGRDLTLVASGWMVQLALPAAERLAADGMSAEVIDLRTIVPLDRDTVLRSVERTGRLLVVDEDYLSYGVSAEIVAAVAEALPDRGVRFARHAVPDVPIPASPALEAAVVPSEDSIYQAAKRLMS